MDSDYYKSLFYTFVSRKDLMEAITSSGMEVVRWDDCFQSEVALIPEEYGFSDSAIKDTYGLKSWLIMCQKPDDMKTDSITAV